MGRISLRRISLWVWFAHICNDFIWQHPRTSDEIHETVCVRFKGKKLKTGMGCNTRLSDDEDLNEEDSLEFDGGFGNVIIVDNNTPQEAELAKEKTNGYKLDNTYICCQHV